MLARLGKILYWIGCIVAVLIATIVTAFLVVSEPGPDNWSMATSDLGLALAIWLTGLALRVLSNLSAGRGSVSRGRPRIDCVCLRR
jgi:hypothetical protein